MNVLVYMFKFPYLYRCSRRLLKLTKMGFKVRSLTLLIYRCHLHLRFGQCSSMVLLDLSLRVLTDHDSGHSQQQGGDEGRSPHRQTQSQMGQRRLWKQEGHVCETKENNSYLPKRSINIHFITQIPDLMNDVKAMTQQSLGAETTTACKSPFSGERRGGGGSGSSCLNRRTNLQTQSDCTEAVTFSTRHR